VCYTISILEKEVKQMVNDFVFGALVGSQNYGLANEKSDSDYKLFVLPTFDDLYQRKELSTQRIGEKVDYTIHDIRKFVELLWKANPAFIEVLFSKRFIINKEYRDWVTSILSRKNAFATMNLPVFYDASYGNYLQKRQGMVKGTSGTADLVEKFGYDTKCFLHAYRSLETPLFLMENGFNFNEVYHYADGTRKVIALDMRKGEFSLEQAYEVLDLMESRMPKVKECLKNQNTYPFTKQWLDNSVYELVKGNLK
jgi:hypothetical protein